MHKNFVSDGSRKLDLLYPWLAFATVTLVNLPAGTRQISTATLGVVVLSMSVLGLSSYCDIRERRIPNSVTYWGCLAALLINFACRDFVGATPAIVGVASSFFGFVSCFSFMLYLYASSYVGAGDVKLAAFVGAVLGFRGGINAVAWAHILGGIFCICMVIRQVGIKTLIGVALSRLVSFVPALAFAGFMPSNSPALFSNSTGERKTIPMAPAFAAGVFVTVLGGQLL